MFAAFLKKENAKSLMITDDAEFKRVAIQMFNGIAFPAEKRSAATMGEAKQIIAKDHAVNNILVDLRSEIGREFMADTETVLEFINGPVNVVLAFAETEDGIKGLQPLAEKLPNFFVDVMPLSKETFSTAYHGRGKKTGQPVEAVKKQPPAQEAKPKSAAQVTAFQSTQHVRSAIDSLNKLKDKKDDVEAVAEIGQRFNALVGTFEFFAGRPGFTELRALAVIVDSIGRTYKDNPDKKEISDDHFQLLFECVKSSFNLLMEIREEKPMTDADKKACDDIDKKFQGMSDLVRADAKSQDEVDSLLEDLTG